MKLFLLFVLLLSSAFFSTTEAAFFSLSRLRLRQLQDSDTRSSAIINKLLTHPDDLLITILMGNTLVNLGASATATVIATGIFGNKGVGIAIGVMTFMILIFGELIPKTIGIQKPHNIVVFAAPAAYFFLKLFSPFVWILRKITTITIKEVSGVEYSKDRTITEEELRTIIDVGQKEGIIGKKEREMIHRVFEFGDTMVKEVMIPRTDMFCMEINSTAEDVLKAIKEKSHSKIPLFEGNIDNIIGILHIKDLLAFLKEGKPKFAIRNLLRNPYFVPETKRVDNLLKEFQAKKIHMAIVVDEYGGTAGLIAMEDLLEELVGEIRDEFDTDEILHQKINDTTYRLSGKLPIDEFNTIFNASLVHPELETIGGYLLNLFGHIPHKNESIQDGRFKFTAEKIHKTRIQDILVQELDEMEQENSGKYIDED